MTRRLAVALWLCTGCSTKETCPADDLACLSDSLQIYDSPTDGEERKLELRLVNHDAFTAAQTDDNRDGGSNGSGALTLSTQARLQFESSTADDLILVLWKDPLGCRPALCFTPCPKNARCLGSTRCTPSLKDGLQSGSSFHRIEYAKQPSSTTEFNLAVTPVAAPGCPADITAAIEAGGVDVLVGRSWFIDVNIPGEGQQGSGGGAGGGSGGGGGGSVGGCLQASTLACTPLGTSGVASTCVTAEEYANVTGGQPLPAACAPAGTTGCHNQNGVLVKPCCEGLTCRVSSSCGGGSTLGGVCAQ